MNRTTRAATGLCFVLALAVTASAKQWRGITPLHSTRDNVRQLLGKPIIVTGISDTYDLEEGRTTVMYARGPCEQGLPSDWGNWRVARGTVVNITIAVAQEIRLSSLKTRNIERNKWYTGDSGATYYRLKRAGIEYQVQQGKITGITFGPTLKDRYLLCRKNVPEMRY